MSVQAEPIVERTYADKINTIDVSLILSGLTLGISADILAIGMTNYHSLWCASSIMRLIEPLYYISFFIRRHEALEYAAAIDII